MRTVRQLTHSLRRWRLLEDVAVWLLYGVAKIIAALPSRWVLALSNGLGAVIVLLDRRGWQVARQNLRVAFGDTLSKQERRRIVVGSCRHAVRAILLLLHLQPLTRGRYLAWVDPPDDAHLPKLDVIRKRGAVLVSGHIGNWELLLGLRVLFPHFPPSVFLAEEIPHHAVNRVLVKLRSHADLRAALRKGGARAVINVVGAGGTAGLLVDRNVRRQKGGILAPFLGLPARTTPLPAWLVENLDVPLFPILCLPQEGGRYRLWLGPDLAADLTGVDAPARARELLTRVNAVLEQVIRARPELWNWTIKRFKSRPTLELGDYPPYSLFDEDPG